ncbi:hypothetical protein N7535_008465 [Penicillium sp. DV-2018c]|nr:hypothetical protein N7461_002223 [Penicillium sp. DV-2018c]KAJ5563301.1 hypothetical protein N7535_008465 [Penicillium sp. DV-2018c]
MTIDHQQPTYDIVIIGAGFSGIYLLYYLRKLGYSVHIYERGSDLGGVWHSNTYPGCRVDTEGSIYQLSIPEVWETWSFTEKYPSADELRGYFAHVEKTLEIKKDVDFSTTVTGAWFDKGAAGEKKWRVETNDGRLTRCRFLLSCVGFAAERYVPDIPGLKSFKGEMCHSANWPKGGVDVAGKKVAVIGTGASGVQIVQAWGKEAESLVVFQRTPNLALPMRQESLSLEAQKALKADLPRLFDARSKSTFGFLNERSLHRTFEVSSEEREARFESLYQQGGFAPLLGGYSDFLLDEKANRVVYDFWVKKTRERIIDPQVQKVLAPDEPPHPIAAKRSSMESDYFDQFNKPNVHLVNLREAGCAIAAIKPEGIELENGTFYKLDKIALATGFNSYTGSLTSIAGLRNTSGLTLAEEWEKEGASTYLGMARKGYPNLFLCYALHGPTALTSGPVSVEMQARWIIDAIRKIDESGLSYVEPTEEAERTWKAQINQIAEMTLFPKADSWYMGANIPGKKREFLNFPGGIPMYEEICRKALQNWEGFVTV